MKISTKDKRILFLTTVIFENPKTGGELVTNGIIKELIEEGFDIDIVGFAREKVNDRNIKLLIERPIESRENLFFSFVNLIRSYLNNTPYTYSKYYHGDIDKFINDNCEEYEYILFDHGQMLQYVESVYKNRNVKLVYICHNKEDEVYKGLSNSTSNKALNKIYTREYKLIKEKERKLSSSIDGLVVLKKEDSDVFDTDLPFVEFNVNFDINMNDVNDNPIYDVVILGTWTWEPNRKGLDWFINDVLPLIDGCIKIGIGGKGLDNYSLDSRCDILGFVDSSSEFLHSGRVICIPSIEGEGVQIKSLEAISTKKKIIGTSKAMRGINFSTDQVLICDDAPSMAKMINSSLDFETYIRSYKKDNNKKIGVFLEGLL
ncbi:glycosyltransferase [Vibrio maerlii]|uniref:glycosyltransferase n=1 Tax=Vibrio maerlii TaxID=2231648 RepID=UPI000E3EDB07|nr:glycosyltransferase [Vibrio maerlii]